VSGGGVGGEVASKSPLVFGVAAGVFAFPAAFVVVADSRGEEVSRGCFDLEGEWINWMLLVMMINKSIPTDMFISP
jgi:uncharacterized spore protein YtfJ